jgi:hypothetical protein
MPLGTSQRVARTECDIGPTVTPRFARREQLSATVRSLDEPTSVVDHEEHRLRTEQRRDLCLDAPAIVDLLLKQDHPIGAQRC